MTLDELYRMADEDNISVDAFKLNKREALSFMENDGTCYIAIDPFQLKSPLDEKMKLGHEMGHCGSGSFYNRWATRDVRKKHENQADKWAIQNFISSDELDEAVAEGYAEMWELAEKFEVSLEFMEKAVCWYTYGNLDVEGQMRF